MLTEVSQLDDVSLYMNTDFPGVKHVHQFARFPRQCDGGNALCLAYNYGFNAAQYALTYAASQTIHSTTWWLDVETENSWSDKAAENVASIQGAIDAVRHGGFLPTIGIYSTPQQWQVITGGWKNGLPEWVGTGSGKQSDAITACQNNDFTGGDTILAQYVLRLDHDYVCK